MISRKFPAAAAAGTCILAVTPCVPVLAQAQDADSSSGDVLQEVIVTARHRAENLQGVPVAVTALSSEALASRGVRNVAEAANIAPNVTFDTGASRSGGGSSGSLFIRGVGQADFFGMFDPGVGIYVDEIYLGRSTGSVLDALDFERVEVLRGPQGTLFGRNTIGGAINITSKRPTQQLEGYIQAELGSYDERNISAVLNLPLSDTLAARLSASQRNRDGTVESLAVPGLRFDDINDFASRAVVEWTASDAFSATFIADTSRQRRGGQAFHLTAVNPTAPSLVQFNSIVPAARTYPGANGTYQYYAPVSDIYITGKDHTWAGTTLFGDPRNDLDASGISANLRWQLSDDIELRSISAYREVDLYTISNAAAVPFDYQSSDFRSDQRQISQEFRLSGSLLSDKLNFVSGIYYFNEVIHELTRSRIINGVYALTGQAPTVAANGPGDHDTDSYAVYADGTFRFTDKFSVSLGGRYTREEKNVGHSVVDADSGVVRLAPSTMERSFTSFTPKLALQYRFGEPAMVYASYSEGFKSGGVTAALATRPSDFSPFGPEEQTTYEVGIKSDLFDRRVRVNVAAFHSDYSDLQLRATLQAGQLGCAVVCTSVVNAAEARLRGVEAEIVARPISGLELSLGGGYLDQKFVYVDPALVASRALTPDRKIPKTPETTLDLSARFEQPVWGSHLLSTSLSYSYRSKTYHSIENDPYSTQSAYDVVNARIAFSPNDGRWEIAATGKNLTDETYIVTANPSFLTSVGVSSVVYAAPRTYSLSVLYRFGEGR
jgi:iron complex outermembrane receptor protein